MLPWREKELEPFALPCRQSGDVIRRPRHANSRLIADTLEPAEIVCRNNRPAGIPRELGGIRTVVHILDASIPADNAREVRVTQQANTPPVSTNTHNPLREIVPIQNNLRVITRDKVATDDRIFNSDSPRAPHMTPAVHPHIVQKDVTSHPVKLHIAQPRVRQRDVASIPRHRDVHPRHLISDNLDVPQPERDGQVARDGRVPTPGSRNSVQIARVSIEGDSTRQVDAAEDDGAYAAGDGQPARDAGGLEEDISAVARCEGGEGSADDDVGNCAEGDEAGGCVLPDAEFAGCVHRGYAYRAGDGGAINIDVAGVGCREDAGDRGVEEGDERAAVEDEYLACGRAGKHARLAVDDDGAYVAGEGAVADRLRGRDGRERREKDEKGFHDAGLPAGLSPTDQDDTSRSTIAGVEIEKAGESPLELRASLKQFFARLFETKTSIELRQHRRALSSRLAGRHRSSPAPR